jgi:itaconate CoA-transferase
VAVHNQQEWSRFCSDVLGRPDLAADDRFRSHPLRSRHGEALTATIEEVFTRLTSAEVLRRLDAAEIANARVNSIDEYLEHPQLSAAESWREVDSPVGPIRALIPPARVEGMEPAMSAIPAVGQHSESVLAELGYERETIARWKQAEII